jgi:hypothetical protein
LTTTHESSLAALTRQVGLTDDDHKKLARTSAMERRGTEHLQHYFIIQTTWAAQSPSLPHGSYKYKDYSHFIISLNLDIRSAAETVNLVLSRLVQSLFSMFLSEVLGLGLVNSVETYDQHK